MDDKKSDRSKIGYLSAVSIGVGGMVGGGIFAVLGLAVQLAGGGTAVAFAVAGVIALLTSYSYAKLSVAYPSQGGTVEFLNQAFGTGVLTGGLNFLLWLSYIVMLALYAFAFGSYGATFFPVELQPLMKHVLLTAVIVLLTVLNTLGSKAVGESEEWVVGFKLTILILFVAVGIVSVDGARLDPSTWSRPLPLMAGGMIIFLAYEGFELIANTSEDVNNPKVNLPRAYYTAVGFVIALYVAVAVVTVGNLPLAKIVGAKDYALAEAARPFLGHAGFTLISIAAVLSTASAINATLYGTSRVSYIIAKEGELPAFLEKKTWNRPLEGLFLTSGLTILIANIFELSSISTMGSAGFLLIFAGVNLSNYVLHTETHSRRWIPLLGAVVCLVALCALVWQTTLESPREIWVLAVMVGASFLLEAVYRKSTGRSILPRRRHPV